MKSIPADKAPANCPANCPAPANCVRLSGVVEIWLVIHQYNTDPS